jgi:hypothetical protein
VSGATVEDLAAYSVGARPREEYIDMDALIRAADRRRLRLDVRSLRLLVDRRRALAAASHVRRGRFIEAFAAAVPGLIEITRRFDFLDAAGAATGAAPSWRIVAADVRGGRHVFTNGEAPLSVAVAASCAVPGLFALIFFATFNNFLGGIFMALLDAYGLSLVSVQVWGLTFGFLSTAFIISGIVIAKTGLGKNPLRTLLMVNAITWATCILFPIQHSYWLLVGGCFIWMLLGPYAEAAEHTTLQKVVPYERQGRVFGFAQSIEQAASPLTAFLIGPLTQFIVIPFMTDGLGARTIGGWFGTGAPRGMALVFVVAGLIGLGVTILAFNSKYYRQLSAAYANSKNDDDGDSGGAVPVTA